MSEPGFHLYLDETYFPDQGLVVVGAVLTSGPLRPQPGQRWSDRLLVADHAAARDPEAKKAVPAEVRQYASDRPADEWLFALVGMERGGKQTEAAKRLGMLAVLETALGRLEEGSALHVWPDRQDSHGSRTEGMVEGMLLGAGHGIEGRAQVTVHGYPGEIHASFGMAVADLLIYDLRAYLTDTSAPAFSKARSWANERQLAGRVTLLPAHLAQSPATAEALIAIATGRAERIDWGAALAQPDPRWPKVLSGLLVSLDGGQIRDLWRAAVLDLEPLVEDLSRLHRRGTRLEHIAPTLEVLAERVGATESSWVERSKYVAARALGHCGDPVAAFDGWVEWKAEANALERAHPEGWLRYLSGVRAFSVVLTDLRRFEDVHRFIDLAVKKLEEVYGESFARLPMRGQFRGAKAQALLLEGRSAEALEQLDLSLDDFEPAERAFSRVWRQVARARSGHLSLEAEDAPSVGDGPYAEWGLSELLAAGARLPVSVERYLVQRAEAIAASGDVPHPAQLVLRNVGLARKEAPWVRAAFRASWPRAPAAELARGKVLPRSAVRTAALAQLAGLEGGESLWEEAQTQMKAALESMGAPQTSKLTEAFQKATSGPDAAVAIGEY